MSLTKPIKTFGTDPELFFQRDGQIIGSERVIARSTPEHDDNMGQFYGTRVIVDGIQAELNPQYAYNVAGLAANIREAFKILNGQLTKAEGTSVCWRGVVPITKAELAALSEEARLFGCQPSENYYGRRPIRANPEKYLKRSAGGHLHFGLSGSKIYDPGYYGRGVERRRDFVAFLDVFVGSIGVLIDREPLAAERRRNYGRAGEFRLTTFGVEYRTLSNFWLRHSCLLDLMCGLSQFAAAIYNAGGDVVKEYVAAVDARGFRWFRHAINKNDYDTAHANLLALRPLFEKYGDGAKENYWEDDPPPTCPLGASNFDQFLQFVERCHTTPLEQIFPVDPMQHWLNLEFKSFRDVLKGM